MKFVFLVSITLFFNCTCSPQSDETQPPVKVIETVIVKVTLIPDPTQLPTEEPKVNKDSLREYVEIIFNDLYSSCVGLSQKDWDSTDSSVSSMIRANAQACVDLINNHEIPLNCEHDYECNQLSTLATEYTTLVTDGWRLFRQGEEMQDEELISEGLGMFWEADLRWIEIRDVIFSLVSKFGWEIHL
jgi:hypothetical protein